MSDWGIHSTAMKTYLDGLHGSIHRCQRTEHNQGNVTRFLLPRARARFVMKHRRIHVAEGDTRLDNREMKMYTRALVRW